MLNRLQYWPVALLVRLIGILPRPLAHAVGIMIGGAVYHLHPRLRRVGLRNLELAFPDKPLVQRRKILRGVYVSLGRLLGEACLFPGYTRKNASEIAVYQGFENFQAAEKRGKRRSAAHRALRRMGGGIVLSLVAGTSHADRCPAARQSLRRCIGHALSRAAWQYHDRQTGICAWPDRRHAQERDRRHSDGYQHDAAAGCLRRLLRHSGVHRQRTGSRGAAYRMRRWFRHSRYGIRCSANIASSSIARSSWCVPATTRPTRSPIPQSSPRSSSNTFAAIPTSGCGCIAAGRAGRQANRRCIKGQGLGSGAREQRIVTVVDRHPIRRTS